jgi:UDP-2-acetamido-3-amino-2,3-dideoxy-glucuronate N-acetyltransferase
MTSTKQIDESAFIHESSYLDENIRIGSNTKIWHFCHILENSSIGNNCSLGQNVVVGPDVNIGNNVKIQNNVSIYKGITIEDNVFCGPSCVFTNVKNPRSAINRKNEFLNTKIKIGASIGANATVICGNEIGAYSFIAAGAVVTKSVPDHALMVGAPAKQVGWMSKSGGKLSKDLICPIDGTQYCIDTKGNMHELIKE